MKVIVTRPRAQAGPLVERLEGLGLEVVECPLIEIERTSDEPIDCAGYEWLIVTSPNGADEIARRGRNLPKVAAVGPGHRRDAARARDRARLRPARLVAGRPARRVPAAGGPRALRRGRELAPRPDRRARRRLRRALPDAAPLARAAGRRRRRPRLGLGRARVRVDGRRRAGRHDRPGDDAASRARSASPSSRRRRRTTSTASSPRSTASRQDGER